MEKNVAGTITEIEYSPIGKVAVMSGTTQKQAYVPLPGGEMLSPGPDTYWHADWLGTMRLATAVSARTVTFDRAFAPFGEMYDTVTGGTSNPNYTGDTQDTVSGEFDTPFRELHPGQSRWISPDPAGVAAVDPTNPQSWNRYAYVGNMPLTFTDPLGLFSACPKPPPNSVMIVPGGVGYCLFYGFPNGCYFMWGSNDASGGMACFFGLPIPGCPSGQTCYANGPGGGTAPPFTDPGPPRLQRQITCDTVLPNGQTVGQVVQQQRAVLQNLLDQSMMASQLGADSNPFALMSGAMSSIASGNGPIDFKNTFKGQAPPSFLGHAGNFAFYAIGSGFLPNSVLDAGASAYSILAGKASSSPGPMLIDQSAAFVRSAGLTANGCQ